MVGSGEEEAVARARGRGVVAGGRLVHRSNGSSGAQGEARAPGVGGAVSSPDPDRDRGESDVGSWGKKWVRLGFGSGQGRPYRPA